MPDLSVELMEYKDTAFSYEKRLEEGALHADHVTSFRKGTGYSRRFIVYRFDLIQRSSKRVFPIG